MHNKRKETHPCWDPVAANNEVVCEEARHERKHRVETQVLLDDGVQVLGLVEVGGRERTSGWVEARHFLEQELLLVRVRGQVIEGEQGRV